jgi:hypothetical protein
VTLTAKKLDDLEVLAKVVKKHGGKEKWAFDSYKEELIDDSEFDPDTKPYVHRWVGECDYIQGRITVVDVEGHGDYAGYIQALDPKTVLELVALARKQLAPPESPFAGN